MTDSQYRDESVSKVTGMTDSQYRDESVSRSQL